MMGKPNRKGRSKTGGQYTTLSYPLLKSPAFLSLSGPAVRVYMLMRTRHNGWNNGSIILSVRECKTSLGMGKSTAHRAMSQLEDRGFIKCRQRGQRYGRHASEWELTDLEYMDRQATNDWKQWRPARKNPGPISETHGPTSGTQEHEKASMVPPQDPSGAISPSSWSHQRDTTNIPCGSFSEAPPSAAPAAKRAGSRS